MNETRYGNLANTSGVGGVITSLYGLLSSSQVAVFIGVAISLLTFLLSFIRFRQEEKQRKFDNKLKLELHEAKLKALSKGVDCNE